MNKCESARNKSAVKKKGRFGVTKAAKFREETPRKGGGFADGSAIPRCNNMMKLPRLRKTKETSSRDNFLHSKYWTYFT